MALLCTTRILSKLSQKHKHLAQFLRYQTLAVNENVAMIRNVGIIAHIDAGKTTTTERMLYYSGQIHGMGEVHDGDTVMDYMDQERERGITISSAAITLPWNNHRINLIDTPGHVDFTLEVERALLVLDGAVTILDASAGVEAQTITVWRQADKRQLPRIIYLNKMDKPNADVTSCIDSIQAKLNCKPLLLQLPVISSDKLTAVVDVVHMQCLAWDQRDETGATYRVIKWEELSKSSIADDVTRCRRQLLEELADFDEALEEALLNDVPIAEVSAGDLERALVKVTQACEAVPVLLGSSYKKTGVQLLMDATIKYLPSPLARLESKSDEFRALVFKIVHEKHRGALSFARIFSGELRSTQSVFNQRQKSKEKVQRMLQVVADEYREIDRASMGDIVALSGLNDTRTGDVLLPSTQVDAPKESDALIGFRPPDPVFYCAIEAPSLGKEQDLKIALQKLTREDPSLRVEEDAESGQTVLKGMGELHLQVTAQRIRSEYKIDARLGPLQIAYRERIRDSVTESHSAEVTSGKTVHRVQLTVTLKAVCGASNSLIVRPHDDSDLIEQRIHRDVLKGLKLGVVSGLSRGPILGCQVTDAQVVLRDLVVKRGTSPSIVAACIQQAVAKCLHSARPLLLEPYMSVEVTVPESRMGAVISDLARRRAQLDTMTSRGKESVVRARCPLAELIGYSSSLRELTSGLASFTMQVSDYDVMGEDDEQAVVTKLRGYH